ncbi:DUF397 domain-containing protein [Micromonospora sp. NPDC003816]|uniref:DUF397 domain-containing protein n=1 Tax=Micromonospora sp. NPDC003816 TaxID=3364224 RepID=UPI00368D6331
MQFPGDRVAETGEQRRQPVRVTDDVRVRHAPILPSPTPAAPAPVRFPVRALPPPRRSWTVSVIYERQLSKISNVDASVPGLLQTSAYARALFRSVGLYDEAEVEQRASARLERQAVLTGERPPQLVAVLDEHVLRRPVGGPLVMREQLGRLVKLATEQPRVRLHVVPASVGAYPGVAGAFVLATLPGGEYVAYLDDQLKGQVIDDTEDVLAIRASWEAIQGEALPPRQSIELLTEVAELTGARWRTSTRSSTNGGNCVEVADNLPGVVAVRDSKDRDGEVLIFGPAAWRAFVALARNR